MFKTCNWDKNPSISWTIVSDQEAVQKNGTLLIYLRCNYKHCYK